MPAASRPVPRVAVIGGGPAGLMAADTLRAGGAEVHVFEAKGSVGRKFLIAGKGGLNLTHSEPRPAFDARYRERAAAVGDWLDDFDGDALRAWVHEAGIDTYVGSSGRVFPMDRKAAPLLRGWVRRMKAAGIWSPAKKVGGESFYREADVLAAFDPAALRIRKAG